MAIYLKVCLLTRPSNGINNKTYVLQTPKYAYQWLKWLESRKIGTEVFMFLDLEKKIGLSKLNDNRRSMLWVILSLGNGLPDWTLSFRGNLVKSVPNLKCVLCDIMNFKYTLGTLCICIDRIYIYSPTVGLLGSFFF